MTTTIVILGILFLYWRMRNLYYKNLDLEYKFKYYKLRDKLRMLVIQNHIEKNDWKFDYLDFSIGKMVEKLDGLNLYMSVYLYIKHKGDKKFIDFQNKLNEQMPKNKNLEMIYREFGELNVTYILSKHYLLKGLIYSIFASMFLVVKTKQVISNSSLALRSLPETSVSYEYAT